MRTLYYALGIIAGVGIRATARRTHVIHFHYAL